MSDAAPPPRPSGLLSGATGWVVAALVGVGFYALVSQLLHRPPPPEFPTGFDPTLQSPQQPPQGAPRPPRRSLGLGFVAEEEGLRVRELLPGGPSERAGLGAGDLLLAVDGRSLRAAEGGQEVLLGHLDALGDATGLTLLVRRSGGGEEEVRVELLPEGTFEPQLAAKLLEQAVRQLLELRRPDGLWPGYLDPQTPSVAVTALAAWALRRAEVPEAGAALPSVVEALLAHQDPDGGLTDRFSLYQHRVYGTSLLLLALGGDEPHAAARARARDWLASAQVQEVHGIDCYDPRWGGWSYRDTYGPDLRTDVSTARFALVALDAGGLPPDAPAWARARAFLDESQNLFLRLDAGEAEAGRERPYRDGGFAFGPRMSKAGSDAVGPLAVYRSYGSATADGLLSLLAVDRVDGTRHTGSDLPRLDERALAALRWLARGWDLGLNPGFKRDAAAWGRGIYLYWLAALAEGLHRAGVWSVVALDGKEHAWAAELVRLMANLHRQGKGAFSGPSAMMHEDSPTLAASLAILTLAAARDRLALGKGGRVEAGEPPPPLPEDPRVVPLQAADAVQRGRAAFQARTCAACHLDDGTGNGPSLRGVGALYLAHERSVEAARERLLRFLRDPQHVPGLLGDPRPPMPPAPSMGVTEGELPDLVAYLLSRAGE